MYAESSHVCFCLIFGVARIRIRSEMAASSVSLCQWYFVRCFGHIERKNGSVLVERVIRGMSSCDSLVRVLGESECCVVKVSSDGKSRKHGRKKMSRE